MSRTPLLLDVACLVIICASFANAQPDHPNLDGWNRTEVRESDLELKIQADKDRLIYAAYFGYFEDYQNPQNSNEFVRVIKRYIPVISVSKEVENQTMESSIVSNYDKKASHDLLEKVRKEADIIGYTRWQVAKDPRTGESVRSGKIESWLKVQNGDWVHDNQAIVKELFSELSAGKKVILVGIKFSLGNRYHIVKVDQTDLISKKEEKK